MNILKSLPALCLALASTTLDSHAQCPGDPGFELQMPSLVGIGEPLDSTVTAPANYYGVLLLSAGNSTIPTVWGNLCLGGGGQLFVAAAFQSTGDEQVINWCHLPCDKGFIDLQAYLQFIAFRLPDLEEWGLSNDVCFRITDQLGTGQEFNAFAADGDLTFKRGSSGGRIAAEDDVKLRKYDVGVELSDSQGARDDLIALDDIRLRDSTILYGNATYGDGNNNSLNNVQTPSGQILQKAPDFSFEDERDLLKRRFTQFAELEINGTNEPFGRTLELTGTDPDLNVFVIWQGEIETKYLINVRVPAGSTAVINVTGEHLELCTDFKVYGATACETIWNFCEAKSVILHEGEIEGTILAPCADVTLNGGKLTGSLLVKSATACDHELREAAFCGCVDLHSVEEQ